MTFLQEVLKTFKDNQYRFTVSNLKAKIQHPNTNITSQVENSISDFMSQTQNIGALKYCIRLCLSYTFKTCIKHKCISCLDLSFIPKIQIHQNQGEKIEIQNTSGPKHFGSVTQYFIFHNIKKTEKRLKFLIKGEKIKPLLNSIIVCTYQKEEDRISVC